jgi:aryl-alcohol dehydrogenase-like predicted oxidoreductase
LEARVGGRRIFDAVQATWNLLEARPRGAARGARGGLRVIVKEALANGRLTARNRAADFAHSRRRLVEVAERLRCPIDALALAAVLAQPWVDVVLSGAATVEQVRSNLGALSVRWDAAADAALRDIVEEPTTYWAVRAAMPWN